MDSNPRRIKEIEIIFTFAVALSDKEKSYLEREARSCPVALSVSDELIQNVKFIYT